MILKFDNPLWVPKLVKLAETVPGTPLEDLKRFIYSPLNQPNTVAYMDWREPEVSGFIYATVETFDGEKCVFIQFCVIKPCRDDKHIGFELLTKVKTWAAEKGLNRIYFITRRNPKGFIHKYHFEMHGSVLKMDLTKER